MRWFLSSLVILLWSGLGLAQQPKYQLYYSVQSFSGGGSGIFQRYHHGFRQFAGSGLSNGTLIEIWAVNIYNPNERYYYWFVDGVNLGSSSYFRVPVRRR